MVTLGDMPHMDGVLSAIFSPDGARIATGGEDNCAQIWSGSTGERFTPALLHSGFVYVVSFSPDRRLLLTGSKDFTARVCCGAVLDSSTKSGFCGTETSA